MKNDNSRSDSDELDSRSPPGEGVESIPGGRREPVFTDFDEDEDYEEADRDTDYASAYEDETGDDEYLEPLEDEDPDEISAEWQPSGAARSGQAAANPWDVAERDGRSTATTDDDLDDDAYDGDDDEYDLVDDDAEIEAGEYDEEPEDAAALARAADEEWDDAEEYPNDLEELEDPDGEEGGHNWPLGLVIVGVVALLLLAAGGYGVIQQRSETQAEIRELQATLATAASPAEVTASREALRRVEQQNENLRATVDRLSEENRRLSDTIADLEKQLAAQPMAQPEAAAPRPAPAAAAPTPGPDPLASAAGGDWFVNFSSYSQRSVAENWAGKLKPSAGKAVVAPSSLEGKTLYRVRIVGLPDKAAAQEVADQLQQAYKLPPLWVGSE